jgi:hypothetical protein
VSLQRAQFILLLMAGVMVVCTIIAAAVNDFLDAFMCVGLGFFFAWLTNQL